MGTLESMFSGTPAPPPPPIAIRDTLFGDMSLDQWTGHGSAEYPWSAFVAARNHIGNGEREAAVKNWREIVAHPGLEPRHYLQAWYFLRLAGHQPPAEIARQVLGVVVELGMEGGLDLLAAYPDHTARYYNFSGSSVVWEHPNNSLDGEIDGLLAASDRVVAQIGSWDKPRPPAPDTDHVRLCFLTPSGLHFGQAHMDIMAKNPIGGPVFYLAAGLMQSLIIRSRTGRPA